MLREIDILLRATLKGYLAIEKETHVSWERDELEEALRRGRFLNTDDVIRVDRLAEVGGPFPACLQQSGSLGSHYHLAGQTTHFYIFAPRPGPDPNQPLAGRSLEQEQHKLTRAPRDTGGLSL